MTDIPEVTEALDGLRMTAADGRMPIVLAGLIERDVATLSNTIKKLTRDNEAYRDENPPNPCSFGHRPVPRASAPATCPTCGSRNPANRKREVDIDGVEFGKPCQHPFHDLPPLSGMSVPEVAAIIALSADPTPTPVSDDAVREALQQLRYLVNEYAPHEGVEALATIESAIIRNHHGS